MLRRTLLAAALLASPAAAQPVIPARPITMVVPSAPGGPIDSLGRVLADAMGRDLGQPVVVQNMPGAGFTIGMAAVARAVPDGTTVLLTHISIATSPALYRSLAFDPRASFAPIGLVTELPLMIVARRDLPAPSGEALLSLARADPARLTLAHAGIGTASHLCGLLFQSALGVKLTEVPYRGTAPAMNDVVAGQVDLLCDSPIGSTVGLVAAGRVRVLLSAGAQRLPVLPEVPSASEAGVPGFSLGIWHGLFAPRETPEPVVARLAAALRAALADQQLRARLDTMAAAPMPATRATPEALRAHLDAELMRWATLLGKAGIRPE